MKPDTDRTVDELLDELDEITREHDRWRAFKATVAVDDNGERCNVVELETDDAFGSSTGDGVTMLARAVRTLGGPTLHAVLCEALRFLASEESR